MRAELERICVAQACGFGRRSSEMELANARQAVFARKAIVNCPLSNARNSQTTKTDGMPSPIDFEEPQNLKGVQETKAVR